MSQLSVSRPPTGLSMASSHKSGGINLPQIQHPLTKLGNPQTLDVRGSSRGSGRVSHTGSLVGRPLPCETPRKSVSQASSRHSKLSRSAPAGPVYETIPEGVEVTQGDPAATRLPIFGNRAGTLSCAGSSREDVQKRVSSRLSMASVQARLEVDEIEMLLRDKVKNNYFDIKNRFIANDPEQKGNVTRDALSRIIVTVLNRPLPLNVYNRLMDRIGLKDRLTTSYTEFFSCFRDAETTEYPQWMDPVQRHYQDKNNMTAQQVHSLLKERVRQKFVDLAELVPQVNPGGSGYILPHEFRNVLEKNNFFMDDDEFAKLWAKYDEENHDVIKGEILMKKLGVTLTRSSGKLSPIESPKHSPKAHNERPESQKSGMKTPKRGTPLRKREQERQMSLDVEKWLKNKFREGYWQLKDIFEAKDPEKTGLISHLEFLEILSNQGLHLEKSYLNTFLARCSVKSDKKGVPYIDFLHKFQDRSEDGVPHKILTDPNHRINTRVDSATYSTMSAVESQLMNMFQRDFLALLGTFHTIDKIRQDLITQEEFRAAIESRFGLEITDDQFRGLIDKVSLSHDGMVKYPQFMAQFDSRGVAKSLYQPSENHVVVETRTPPALDNVIELADETDAEQQEEAPQSDRLVIHKDEIVDEFPKHRSTKELFLLIKDLLKRRYQDVEKAFYDIDDVNSGQLSQEMMYQLLKRFDIQPEVSRGEIRDLWTTFIVSQRKTLNYLEFVRHFGYSLKSAAYPNAKIRPPRRGDADCMQRSRKLNSTHILITDNIRSKIEYYFDELTREFADMDPYNTGFVSQPEFKDILTELNIHIADWEMEEVAKKFDSSNDGRISYVEFLRPFASRRQGRDGDNILALLNQPQARLNVSEVVEPPQKGLYGITAKLRQKFSGDWKTLRRAFKKLDSDNTGYLSLAEFRSVLKLANVILDEDELYHLMSEYDEGLTGNIQYSKFLKSTFRGMESRNSIC